MAVNGTPRRAGVIFFSPEAKAGYRYRMWRQHFWHLAADGI